jgi:hypothetical protein
MRTSRGRGFIENIQEFLFHLARLDRVEKSLVRELDDLHHMASHLCREFRARLAQVFV